MPLDTPACGFGPPPSTSPSSPSPRAARRSAESGGSPTGRPAATALRLNHVVPFTLEMTCRAEILDAARALERRGNVPFSPAEVVAVMEGRGTRYPRSTILTHIVSAMCIDAPPNHRHRYADLERVARGLYRVAPSAGGPGFSAFPS